jgi:hypothetical protein
LPFPPPFGTKDVWSTLSASVAKRTSIFRRILRTVFNRWTLTIITLALSTELLAVSWSPLNFARYSGDRVFIFSLGLENWGKPPTLYAFFSSEGSAPDKWQQFSGAGPGILENSINIMLPMLGIQRMNAGTVAFVSLPITPLIMLCLPLTGYLHGRARGGGKIQAGVCRKCRYPLTTLVQAGMTDVVTCPECGTVNARPEA